MLKMENCNHLQQVAGQGNPQNGPRRLSHGQQVLLKGVEEVPSKQRPLLPASDLCRPQLQLLSRRVFHRPEDKVR